MTTSRPLTDLTNNVSKIKATLESSIEACLASTVQIRGSFPSSLDVINKISRLSGESDLNALVDLISSDQILALRTLAISNYSYYRPPTPILTVSAAANHFGVQKLLELVSNLAENKNFNSFYLGRAVASTMMQQALIAGNVAKKVISILAPQYNVAAETYLFSSLINAYPLMLASFQPLAYSALCLDCLDDHNLFAMQFKELTGKSLGANAAIVAGQLGLPKLYHDLAIQYDLASTRSFDMSAKTLAPEQAIATSALIADLISHELCYFTGIQGIQSLLRYLEKELGLNLSQLEDILATVPDAYIEHTDFLGIKPLRLPEYLIWFSPIEETVVGLWQKKLPSINERIGPFLYELRQTMANSPSNQGTFAHAVHCTLNALVRGLNFDRAVFFAADSTKSVLSINMAFGIKLFEPSKIKRFITDSDNTTMPDIQAFKQRKPVFMGEPVFADSWPFVAFPVVWKNEVIGVFYADKIRRPNGDALLPQEEIACIAISEEWQDIPAKIT
ncbi:MAG: HDOD domain-containing protein [Bdellovibrionota bacterium]|jgi:hypothetical protein